MYTAWCIPFHTLCFSLHENRDCRANGSPLKAFRFCSSPLDGGGSPLCRSPHRRLPQRSPQTYASITWDHQLGLHQRPGAGQPASALLLSYGGVFARLSVLSFVSWASSDGRPRTAPYISVLCRVRRYLSCQLAHHQQPTRLRELPVKS